MRIALTIPSAVLGTTAFGPIASARAATIFASDQLLTPGDPNIPPGQPGHDDARQNFVYSIDTNTSVIFFGFGSAVPEPASLGLLGFGGAALLRRRTRRH